MRIPSLALLAALLAFSLSCHEGDTTIVNNNLDCGLVRSELLGNWNVSVGAGTTQLTKCINEPPNTLGFNNLEVIIPPGTTFSFKDMQIFASSNNVGYFFHDSAGPENILGNVETDSCNMLFSLLVQASSTDPTPLYLQCIGTFDRQTRFISASCDSVTVLQSPLTNPAGVLADCDLTLLVQSSITIQ